MKVKKVTKKSVWEGFLEDIDCSEKTFLQAWNWGEFNKSMGDRIWRLGLFNRGQLKGLAQVIKEQAKRGNFLLVPHAPIIKSNLKNQKSKILRALTEKLKQIGKEQRCSFIRVAPIWKRTQENKQIFKKSGFRKAPIHVHAEQTWVLDLKPSLDELLMDMRKSTRRAIRKAREMDIKVHQSKKIKDVEKFNRIYRKVVQRQDFTPFSLEYLKKETAAFAPHDQARIFLAEYKGEMLSSAIIIFWQDSAFYHQGATDLKYPKVPLSQLLQWEVIKEAKKQGLKEYNFWGIAPEESGKDHPWKGLTFFKRGFGGQRRKYLKTYDLPLGTLYWPTFLFELLRSKKRGF